MSEKASSTESGESRGILRAIFLVVLLWLFLCSVNGIGASFKFFKDVVELILGETQASPILGLLVGVLTTSLVQSSSTTTSLIVGLVASGAITVSQAIPMIMGANIGTTITNTLVSLGSITRRDEFRRAFAAANIHDVFNLLAVSILLPLESMFHMIEKSAGHLTTLLIGAEVEKPHSVVKAHFKSVIKSVTQFFREHFEESTSYLFLLILSVGVMIASLALIVKTMRGPVLAKAEVFFDKFVGRSGLIAMAFGAILTATVQSSSVTTSLMVPLAGAGAITLANLLPITLGCNLGTTITALMAAIASGTHGGLVIALCHVIFNLYGILLLYTLKRPRDLVLFLSQKLADLSSQHRWFAPLYVLVLFFCVPGVILIFDYWDRIVTWF